MSCESIPVVDIFVKLHEKANKDRFPVNGGIDITSRCNLRCVHCYIQGTKIEENELSYAEICHIFDQLADEGCLSIVITGGEPLLRPDFKDIYSYAKRKGLLIILFTNGTLLTPSMVDFLAEQPPYVLEITLYGMTKETYERVTGVPGSFERCMRGIELWREKKLPLRLKTMGLTLNHHEIPDMERYAKELGVHFRYDFMINAKLDGTLEPTRLRLSPDEVVAHDLADEKRADGLRQFCERLWGTSGRDDLYVCGAGVKTFHISSTGKLDVCLLAREPNYDLRSGTFHDGFYNEFPKVRAQKRTKYSECQSCPMKNLCGQCPGWGLVEHGDREAKVEWLCEVAKRRAAAFKTGYQEEAACRVRMTTPATR